ncbi:MAG: ATP-binding protein [Neomegalonema sp.]|nr:ATP-binding protein [Neomegalonema sp.]
MILFALSTLIALHLVGVASAFWERARDTGAGVRFPLPGQAAAIAELVGKTAPAELKLVLSAVNSPDVRVQLIRPDAPAARTPDGVRRLAPVERAVLHYVRHLKPRSVVAYLVRAGDDAASAWAIGRQDRFNFSNLPLRLDITLADGPVVRIETRGDLTRRLWGWPLGLLAGGIAVLIALLSVRAMWREIRPLTELAARVDRFARAARPQLMKEDGPEEIRAVIGAFNRMQTRLADLLKARSVMLGALGHDLRTYLTRLRLRAELIDHPDQQERIVRDLDAMDSVISASTALARLEGGPLEAQETGLAPIFERLAALHPSLRVIETPALADAVIWGDRHAIHLALDNLISNAMRYGRASAEAPAEVELCVAIDDDPMGGRDPVAVVSVLDRGPGLEEGATAHLFDAFVRGDAARNLNAPGSGLGLAIVAAVARAHRGAASLHNRPGGGMEARLTLPMAF